MDRAANQRGSGVGLVLMSPEKITIEKSLRLSFSATNNEAEYEALLMGMAMVQKMEGKAVKVFSDSKLVVGQVRGDLEARDPRMQEYLCQSGVYKQNLKSLTYLISPEVGTPMQTLWLPSPCPRRRICFE